ncbi:MAG: tetratricopeptide repeat protein [Candidatus Omnitrophota bacterium]|nr:MAG: tetratricopeptide repeat protein [Candidatus Omnitrophota bacterium]
MKIIWIIFILLISAVTTLIYQHTQQADMNYHRGQRFFEKGEFEKAIELYEKALTINPSHPQAVRDLAYARLWTGGYQRAIELFDQILASNPKDHAIMRALTEAYMWSDQFEKAKNTAERILKENPDDYEAQLLLAKTMQYSGKVQEAAEIYEDLMEKEKEEEKEKKKKKLKKQKLEEQNLKFLQAQALLYSGNYERAEEILKEILRQEPGNIKAKSHLADIYAYSGNYQKSLSRYDEILAAAEDEDVRLRKARVLGWAREYEKSKEEYRKILSTKYNEKIELELKAKEAYWNNRIRGAISYYKRLIEKDPKNVEAMFDVSQIYSYQSMWKEAEAEYKRILSVYPLHFRAKEALEKVELIARHISLKSGYEFFEADSSSRESDIRRHTFFNRLALPINYNLQMEAGYNLTSRSFSDFGDVLENEARIAATYLQGAQWWINGFYDFIEYNKDIDSLHTFGGELNFRFFDLGTSGLSFQRERLENSSQVIRRNYYRDNYKQRLYLDITKRLKAGIDHIYSNYSDGNYKHETGADILYYLWLEPKRLSVKYRYFFRDFDNTVQEYFSPRDFSTHKMTIDWRHFLNKEEPFFGADDLYYDLIYDIAVDSEDIVNHKFSVELNRDINKRLNFNIKASLSNSSTDVYKDESIMASVKYYF